MIKAPLSLRQYLLLGNNNYRRMKKRQKTFRHKPKVSSTTIKDERCSLFDRRTESLNNASVYYKGKLISLGQFSATIGLPFIITKYRYAQNWDVQWIMDSDIDNRFYPWLGHHYNLYELELLSGISYSVLFDRLINKKWSVEDSIV